MAHTWQGGESSHIDDEEEVDRIAEAVMVLKRSGLFKVKTVEVTQDDEQSREDTPFTLREGFKFPYVNRRRRNRHPISPTFSPRGNPSQTPLMPPASFTARGSSTPFPVRNTTPECPLSSSNPGVLPVLGHVPRISTFSCVNTKTDVSFQEWRFEVRCLLKDRTMSRDLLLQGVRKSLKGEPGKLCMHLGEGAMLEDIMKKLEGVYGTVESGTTLLQQFYNCKQEENETIVNYSFRLEDVLNKAMERGAVAREQWNEMLKGKLWTSLRDERIRATRYKLEQINNFDILVGELRAAEQEIKELDSLRDKTYKTSKAWAMPQAGTRAGDSLDELVERIKDVEEKVPKHKDTTKLLNQILDKIDRLEEKTPSEDACDVEQRTETQSKPSNYRGSLRRDNQRANQR